MSQWSRRAVCRKCGFNVEAPFGDKFHVHLEICPRCGTDKYNWRVYTMRIVHDGQFLKPRTWGVWHYEILIDDVQYSVVDDAALVRFLEKLG